MFPLSHLYAANKVCDITEPAFIVGSVLPDIAYTGVMSFPRSHSMAEEFDQYIRLNHPEWTSMAEGVTLHVKPRGLDLHSDVDYQNKGVGWAYILSEHLVDEVGECCGVSGKTSVKAAHWFIEMAVDMYIAGDSPDSLDILRSSMESVGPDIVSKILGGFLDTDEAEVKPSAVEFFRMLGEYAPTSINASIDFYSWINRKMFSKDIDEELGREILQKALDRTRDEYETFMSGSIENMIMRYG